MTPAVLVFRWTSWPHPSFLSEQDWMLTTPWHINFCFGKELGSEERSHSDIHFWEYTHHTVQVLSLLQQNSLMVQTWASFSFSSRMFMMSSLSDPVFSWKNIIRAMLEGQPVLILMVRLINYICTPGMLLSLCLTLTAESSFIGYTWFSLINDNPCQGKWWNKVKFMWFCGRHYLFMYLNIPPRVFRQSRESHLYSFSFSVLSHLGSVYIPEQFFSHPAA